MRATRDVFLIRAADSMPQFLEPLQQWEQVIKAKHKNVIKNMTRATH